MLADNSHLRIHQRNWINYDKSGTFTLILSCPNELYNGTSFKNDGADYSDKNQSIYVGLRSNMENILGHVESNKATIMFCYSCKK